VLLGASEKKKKKKKKKKKSFFQQSTPQGEKSVGAWGTIVLPPLGGQLTEKASHGPGSKSWRCHMVESHQGLAGVHAR
jgi:hypothetical protein